MLAIVPMPKLDTLSCQATEPQLRSVTLHYATALSVASPMYSAFWPLHFADLGYWPQAI